MDTKMLLYITVIIGLMIQIITASVDVFALTFNYIGDLLLLKGLISIELFVQFIEIIFYLWFYINFKSISNATPKRYYDWVITTPSMLFILIVYLDYLNNKEKVPEIDDNDDTKTMYDYLEVSFNKHKLTFYLVLVLNFFMLMFGYLGETKIINKITAFSFGFVFFISYFYIIYNKYAKYNYYGTLLLFLFAGIWSFYGLASLMPYVWKNITYNILDVISKNFFGLFLAYLAYVKTRF
jgi:hypothetical protein